MSPHELVGQIMLDFRITKKEADRLRNEIQRRTGFKGPILRSLLYTLPSQLSRLAQTQNTSRLTAAALDGGRSNIWADHESVARPPQVSRKPLGGAFRRILEPCFSRDA